MTEYRRIYWARRANCDKQKHKFRINNAGVTWCVICGQLANKPSVVPLLPEDKYVFKINN